MSKVPKKNGGEKNEIDTCLAILKDIVNRPEAEPFLEPVNWKELGLFDYPKIIKRPMDLGTIQKRAHGGKYADGWAFAEDMRLVWENAKTYNRPGSGIYLVAEQLQDLWEKKFKKIPKRGVKRVREEGMETGDAEEHRFMFTELLKKLNCDQIGTLVDMIEKSCPKALHEEDYEDDLEIEVSEIDFTTLKDCNSYAQECLDQMQKAKRKKT